MNALYSLKLLSCSSFFSFRNWSLPFNRLSCFHHQASFHNMYTIRLLYFFFRQPPCLSSALAATCAWRKRCEYLMRLGGRRTNRREKRKERKGVRTKPYQSNNGILFYSVCTSMMRLWCSRSWYRFNMSWFASKWNCCCLILCLLLVSLDANEWENAIAGAKNFGHINKCIAQMLYLKHLVVIFFSVFFVALFYLF